MSGRDDIERKADALERLMSGNCDKGHKWVKEKGKPGLVCLRCGRTAFRTEQQP